MPARLRQRLAAELPPALRAGHRVRQRPRRHGQVPLGTGRRCPRRDRADAVSRPGHGVRLQPGRLRHGLRLLCHGAGGLHTPPDHRRDRRAGRARGTPGERRRPACRQRRVHGHGRAARQRGGGVGCRAAASRRRRAVRPAPHDLDGRDRPRHPPARRARATCDAGRQPARRQRPAARRAGADQPSLPPRRR